METIKVHVVDKGRGALYMRYVDPCTGKDVTRTTGTSKRSEATKAAGVWQKELREGKYKPPSRVTWAEFRDEFEQSAEYRDYAEASQRKFDTAFDLVEEILSPDKLSSLTTARISHLSGVLRDRELADFTVKGYLAMIRRAMYWAKANGKLHEVPAFVMPKHAKGDDVMKGRAITEAEYHKMLKAIPECVRAVNVAKWERLLHGLWLSGLRLGEAINLWWDRTDRNHIVITGQRAMLHFRAKHQKNRKNQIVPASPEFSAFLLKTPEAERTGLVFPMGARSVPTISDVISRIGEEAEVLVNDETGKYASAHDFRRAFGARWARKVMPATLQKLMRHADIKTTMRFYAEQTAEDTADVVWEASGVLKLYAGDTLSDRQVKSA